MSESSLSVVGAGSLPGVRVLPGEGGLQDAEGLSLAAGSAVSLTDGGASGKEGVPSSVSSAALPWGFAGYTKTKPEFSVWNPESWRPAVKRGADALRYLGGEALRADRLRRRAGALDALCLRGKDPVFDKRIGECPEFAYILKAAERGSETFHHLIGYEAAALGNGDAYGLASRLIDARPERERGALRRELSACKSERDGLALVGRLIDESAAAGWQEVLRKREEFKQGLDLFGKELLETLPQCVRAGGSLPPALLEKATRYGNAQAILSAHKKASEAFEQVKSLNRGGMPEGTFAARVQLRAEALEKDFYGSWHFGWPGTIHIPTKEEFEQQARADLGEDIAVSREQMAGALDLLRDEDGRVDPRALAAFKLAVVAEMTDQQTIIDSKFWRNFGEGVADYVKNSTEFVERTLGPPRSWRYVPAAGGLASGVWTPVYDPQREARARAEWERKYKDPNVNAFVDFLRTAESVRLSASDAAGTLTILLSDLGTAVGENAIPLGISALTGGGALMAGATYAPMGINRTIDSAYAEGKSNPELYGWVVGGAEAVAEGSFGATLRGLPMAGRLAGRALDKAALRMMEVPVLGRALGAVQSRGYLRYAVSGALETGGELVGENYIAQALSYPAIEVLRACGADLDRAVFNPWEVSREGLMNQRQVAATGTYCFLLGLLHAPAQHKAALDFSRDRRQLLAAGLTQRSADSLAAEAEMISRRVVEATMKQGAEEGRRLATELGKGFSEKSFSVFDREVIQESTRNPEALRDRLARENGLFMSQVEAETAYREGVLQVALREMGVLSAERTLSGKNVVVFVDEKRAAEDRKGWKDGVAPEGYELPSRREEWTDDQLLAYAQVAFDSAATRRMKTIRSAALALDMAQRINEGDYAGTIPLTRAGAHVSEVLKKNGGRMNANVMKALAEAAHKEGEAGRNLLPGVHNVVLQGVGRSFVKRLEWEGRHGDAGLASRILSGKGGAGAVRVNAYSGPASRILMNPGTTLSLHLAEDAVESMLVQKLRDEGGLDEDGAITPAGAAWLAAMHGEMLTVRAQILAATGKDVMPGLEKAEPGLQSVTEYFSHLAQSSFYRNAGETNLSPEAARHVRYMDSALMQAKFLHDMGAVYAEWSRTPAGEKWLQEGGSLAVLLESAGHELHRLYSQSKLTHENVASVEEARRAAREAEEQGEGTASTGRDAGTTFYAEADGFAEASGFALADDLKENIELATENRLKARTEIPLCSVPRSLVALGERDAGIVTSAGVIKKLKNKHGLSNAEIYNIIEKIDDPLLAIKDGKDSYMFLLDMTAANNKGTYAPVIAALAIRKDGDHFMLSAYALDSMQKVNDNVRAGKLVYSSYTLEELKEAEASSNYAPGLTPDLVRLLVGHGFRNNPITRADFVKRTAGERMEDDASPSVSFSLLGEQTAERELPGIRGCIDALAEGKESAEIQNAAWGHTITVPRGTIGKPDTGKHGFGVDHVIHKRLLHGLSEDEAAFVAIAAFKAAESVRTPHKEGNSLWFERFGIRAVIAESDDASHRILTGFVLRTQGDKRAVDKDAADRAHQFYALDELRRVHQVGAALKRAYARFETIVKQNPRTWESAVEHEIAKLRVKQNSKQNGTFMREADGSRTTLSEEAWLTLQTGALDSIGEGRKGVSGNDGGRPEGRDGSTSSFSIIGEHAATWDKHKQRAFTGRADGKARAELDASQAKMLPGGVRAARKKEVPLGRVVDFPELFEAYPQLSDLPVRFSALGRLVAGSLSVSADSDSKTILLNEVLKPEAVLPVVLHEVQHAVQQIEGFAPGGTLLDAYDIYARRLNAMIDELEGAGRKKGTPARKAAKEPLPRLSGNIERTVTELNELLAALADRKGKIVAGIREEAVSALPRLMELYRNLPGEVEARRVSERLGLSAEERAEQPFEADGQVDHVPKPGSRGKKAETAATKRAGKVRTAESRVRDALDGERSSGMKPKERSRKDQSGGSRAEAPLAEDVGLISEKQALKRLSRRYEVRDMKKRPVRFGEKSQTHLTFNDKDRSDRLKYLLLAEDTVKTGKTKGKFRRHYGKVYRDASGKEFGILVIVVKDRAGRDEVFNFLRITPASRLWNSVEQNDKK